MGEVIYMISTKKGWQIDFLCEGWETCVFVPKAKNEEETKHNNETRGAHSLLIPTANRIIKWIL